MLLSFGILAGSLDFFSRAHIFSCSFLCYAYATFKDCVEQRQNSFEQAELVVLWFWSCSTTILLKPAFIEMYSFRIETPVEFFILFFEIAAQYYYTRKSRYMTGNSKDVPFMALWLSGNIGDILMVILKWWACILKSLEEEQHWWFLGCWQFFLSFARSSSLTFATNVNKQLVGRVG